LPRRRLARGLADVSHVFLSGAAGPAEQPDEIRNDLLWMPNVRFIAVTSGDGTRGKSLLAANLAHGLQSSGREVALVNADSSRPDILDLTGTPVIPDDRGATRTNPEFGELLVADACERNAGEAAEFRPAALGRIHGVARQVQVVVADVSMRADIAGDLWQLSNTVIVLAEPNVNCMRSSYAGIKQIHERSPDTRIGLVVNLTTSYSEGERCHRKLSSVCRRFLKINLRNYGSISRSEAVDQSFNLAMPLVRAFPGSQAARSVKAVMRLVLMDESAIARRRMEVRIPQCALREGR
jgi:flagellar biosynthesis protein FlhG